MHSKTAIITGGTSGIGLSIVKHLAKLNYAIYFIGSNFEKGKAIENELSASSLGAISFIQLDLSNLQAVKLFTEDYIKKHKQLDLLANIAGALLPKQETNAEGIEKTFAISYLSAYILSTALVPLLKKTPNSRIINVGAAPKIVLKETLDFDMVYAAPNYNAFRASSQAVHAKTVLTQILSENLSADDIVVNSFDPGMVRTGLMRKMPLPFKLVMGLFFLFVSKRSKEGINASTSHELNGKTGKLLIKNKSITLSFTESYKKELLQKTEELIDSALRLQTDNIKIT